MDEVLRLGRCLFAISLAFFGIQHLIYSHDALGLISIPPYTAKGPISAYWIGSLLIVASLSLANRKGARASARLLGTAFFLDFLIVHAPAILTNVHSGNIRTRGFETLAMAAAALVLAGAFPTEESNSRRVPFNAQTAFATGRFFFVASLAIFGIQHFMYLDFIASLIPAWIPGRLFWAAFTGVGFLAAALSILLNRMTRLAGILLAAMFFLWVAVLHVPRVAHALHNGDEWASMLVALNMGATGLIFAGALPDRSGNNSAATLTRGSSERPAAVAPQSSFIELPVRRNREGSR